MVGQGHGRPCLVGRGLLEPFVDCADHQLEGARLVVLDVDPAASLAHHHLRELPVVVDVAHHGGVALLLVGLPDSGPHHDVPLDEPPQPLLPILTLLGLGELLGVDLYLKLLEGRLVFHSLHVFLVLLEDVVNRGDILVENLADVEQEPDHLEEVCELYLYC